MYIPQGKSKSLSIFHMTGHIHLLDTQGVMRMVQKRGERGAFPYERLNFFWFSYFLLYQILSYIAESKVHLTSEMDQKHLSKHEDMRLPDFVEHTAHGEHNYFCPFLVGSTKQIHPLQCVSASWGV